MGLTVGFFFYLKEAAQRRVQCSEKEEDGQRHMDRKKSLLGDGEETSMARLDSSERKPKGRKAGKGDSGQTVGGPESWILMLCFSCEGRGTRHGGCFKPLQFNCWCLESERHLLRKN